MKTGKTLSQLALELERQKETKRDFLAPVSTLSIDFRPDFPSDRFATDLKIKEVGDFEMTDIAHDQMSEYTGIPLKYYRKLRDEAPVLLSDNVNHWLSQAPDTQRMVRTLDNKARAFLSSRYRPLDNHELAEIALPQLLESGCRIESCDVTEKRMYIKAVTEKVSFEVKKGDIVQAGIVISNSEVGMGALSIEPLLFRLICLNGAIINDAKMRRTHLGRGNEQFDGAVEFFRDATKEADDRAFWLKVQDTIGAAFSQIAFDKFAERWQAATQDRITADPLKVVEMTKLHFSLAETERNSILKHLLTSDDLTKFGLANAITRTAQDVESYDRATELERLGGTVIELPKREWTMLAEAA